MTLHLKRVTKVLVKSKAGISQSRRVVFNMKKVKMKRPWRPLSDFSFCGRSTCRLEAWKYANSICLDAAVCCRSIDVFIASAVASINKSISPNLGVQMVKTSLRIWLWQMAFVIDLTLRWTTEEKSWSVLHRRKFWMWEKVILWAVIKQAAAGEQSRQHIRPSSFQPALSSAACESAISVPRFLAFNSSPWQQEQAWLRELARRQGEGTLPQTLTSEFTFSQPRPRLAKTLPRAIRYFLMNYISELKMKGLRVSQKQGNQIVFKCG